KNNLAAAATSTATSTATSAGISTLINSIARPMRFEIDPGYRPTDASRDTGTAGLIGLELDLGIVYARPMRLEIPAPLDRTRAGFRRRFR
ncbi:hypothetical protein BGZ46_006614, partial [Entomortierella lignicola]